MSNFHPLEVVGRGSETQLQVSENWKKDILAGKRLKSMDTNDNGNNNQLTPGYSLSSSLFPPPPFSLFLGNNSVEMIKKTFGTKNGIAQLDVCF